MVKTNNTDHSGYASYSRGTKTAEVEGLCFVETLKLVPEHAADSNSSSQTPRAQLCSPFIVSYL